MPIKTGIPYLVLVKLSEELRARGANMIELYDGKLLVGKAEVVSDNEFTPVIAWGGSQEYEIQGFIKGHPIAVRVLAYDGSLLASAIKGKFGEGPYAEVEVDVNDVTLNLQSAPLPTEFSVTSIYPNPFNSELQVTIGCPRESEIQVDIYDILGRCVATIHHDYLPAGYHCLTWQAEAPSGIYLLRVISSTGWTDVRKVVLLQ